eukprot:scaffold97176_cov29-Tisochrysis_lutea.AAC.1
MAHGACMVCKGGDTYVRCVHAVHTICPPSKYGRPVSGKLRGLHVSGLLYHPGVMQRKRILNIHASQQLLLKRWSHGARHAPLLLSRPPRRAGRPDHGGRHTASRTAL